MIRVLIVDDELLMRIGLKSMIDWEERGFRIVGEAANGKEALELAGRTKPDLIITDIKMPVMDGLELIREASRVHSGCQYVILSCLEEFHFAQEALRLGAVDYLIKSDIKPADLTKVLDAVKSKQAKAPQNEGMNVSREEIKEGIGYLKETLFKELLSGYRDEAEVIERSEALNIGLEQAPMLLAKLRIDRFDEIRGKYVEQDERLLRYSVVNILEEIIPRKWRKEIIVMNSAEYLLIVNVSEEETALPPDALNMLFGKIMAAMKDFLNLAFSIGVGSPASGFGGLRRAYREADAALRNLFFDGETGIAHYSASSRPSRDRDGFRMSAEEESAVRQCAESSEEARACFEKIKKRLLEERVSERAIRRTYLRLLSLIASSFPNAPEFGSEGRTPYEQVLKEESLERLHRATLHYLDQCLALNAHTAARPRSYAEQAIQLIISRYGEDISLQSVADQICVNASYLSRVFKQETGENFVGFLTRIRIEKAQQLLKDRSAKVYEVADRVGYPNTAYFSRIFKKATGRTPEEYRA